MGSLVEMGLSNALIAGILAVVALIAGRYSRRPALVHSLWVLVLIKLVTPPLVPLPIPGWRVAEAKRPVESTPGPDASAGPIAQANLPVFVQPLANGPANRKIEDLIFDPLAKPMPPMPPAISQPAVLPVVAGVIGDPVPPTIEPKPSPFAPTVADLTAFVFVLWIVGSIVCFLWTIQRVRRFSILLREARPASEQLQGEAVVLAERLGLGRCPSVWLIPGPVPPLLWAVGGKAQLYFPSSLLPRLPESGRAALLMHELAHLARRDHWVRWLELVVSCLYWWYPLVWLARQRLSEAEEECCDAWVTSELPNHRPAYAGALLQTVDFLSRTPGALPPAGSGFGRVHQMKRRLTMIVRGSTPREMSWAGKLLILALMALLPLVPSPGQTAAPPKSDKDKAATQKQADPTDGPEEPSLYQNNPRTLQGGGGQVWQTAVSPDGKTLAVVYGGTGQNEGALTLYDLPDGKERVTLTEVKPIRSVSFSPDGKHLATGDFNNVAHLRDPKTGGVRLALSGHSGSVNGLTFTPDSKQIVTASLDKTLKVWQVSDGKNTHTLTDHTDWVLNVSISRDGKTMLSTSRDMTARVWDVPAFKTRHVLKGHTNWVESGAISPDNKTLATFGLDGKALVWNATSGKLLHDHAFQGASVLAGVFLAGGKTLMLSTSNRMVYSVDVETSQPGTDLDTGHTANVYALTATPDGKTLITGSWDKSVKLWDIETREEKKSLQPKRYREDTNFPILALACSPDGKTLAVSGEEKGVKILDADTGSMRFFLEGHDDIVGGVAFSVDGKTLATAGFDGQVMLWDVATGRRKDVLKGHENWVFAVSYSPDGKWLASAGYDRTVRIWDAKTGKHAFTLSKHKGGVRCIAWSADSKQLASGGTDKSVRVWNVAKKEVVATLKGHEDIIRGVAFLPDSKRLLTASEDQTVRGWNIAEEKQAGVYQHNDVIRGICLSPRGRSLAVVAQDRSIRLLDPITLSAKMTQYPHQEAVTCAAFSPDAKALFSGSSDRSIRRFESALEARAPLLTFRDGGKQMWFASYSPDGKWLATGGTDKVLRVRPSVQGTREWALEGLNQAVFSIAVSPDGNTLAAGLANNTIGLWDARSGKRKGSLGEAKPFRVWMVAFSPDGKKLATVSGSWDQAGEPGEARVWDLTSNKVIGDLPEHSSPVMALAWSKDGKLLVTGARDGSARLIDATTLKPKHEMKGHTDAARYAVFSPDDRYIATAGFDGTIRIWNVSDGKSIVTLKGHEGGMNCVSWSSDGKTLAAVPRPGDRVSVGEVYLWDIVQNGEGPPTFKARANLKGHTSRLLACAFSPDGKSLATTGGNYGQFGETIVWDVAKGKERMLLHGHRIWCESMTFGKDGTLYTGGGTAGSRGELRAWQVDGAGWTVPNAFKGDLTCAAWSKDGKTLATGAGGGNIKVWDAATGKMKVELTGHKSMVRSLAFSPDGKTLASGGSDNTVRLWDLDGDTEAIELAKFEQNVTTVAFSPDGSMLAAGSADPLFRIRTGDVKVFDVKTGKERPGAQWARQGAMSVAFSPDGKYLATGASGANTLRIYDVKSGKLLRTANGANSIRTIAWSPDGKRIAAAHGTGSPRGNGSIQIWDMASGQEVMALTGHTTLCLGISYSPDGKRLASASNDATVNVWDLTASGLPAVTRTATMVRPPQ